MLSTLGNLIWFFLGGVWLGLGWWLAGVVMAVSIIGLPWARSCFVLGGFCFFPFGREAIGRDELSGQPDLGTGALGLVGNVLWFLLAGWWLALGHLAAAVANALTIIGIPFAVQHVKLALCALAPVGKTVVSKEMAEQARRRNATWRG